MKCLVDAQLPRRLARWLISAGHDALHTLDLPTKNLTEDDEVSRIADSAERIVVTKDSDFVDTFLLFGRPRKLLLLSVGNISNDDLLDLMSKHLPEVVTAFQQSSFVELTATAVFVHE